MELLEQASDTERRQALREWLAAFKAAEESLGTASPHDGSIVEDVDLPHGCVTYFTNEFWTARQRQAHSLHEISYRACFKPQLPRFFIRLLTRGGDTVYDPFSGRGTTPIEAALAGRRVVANDINPVSRIFTRPRLHVPTLDAVRERLAAIPVDYAKRAELDLSMFYHPDTEAEIVSLRDYLAHRSASGLEDPMDAWIRMVATNRLTGHSPGFFSVYTLPPNQAVSRKRQQEINKQRGQTPQYKDTKQRILKKTASLLRDLSETDRRRLLRAGERALLLERDARSIGEIPDASVQLTVTSPPFLDVVDYERDNWLRGWFNNLDAEPGDEGPSVCSGLEAWCRLMRDVFSELFRLTRPGGWIAFEVGEVRKGSVKLEEHAARLAEAAGLTCCGVLVNRQRFTKTANIWGISNNSKGTNSNRVVLLQKPEP
jgi:hypothetical protein